MTCKTGAQQAEDYADKCERDQDVIITAPREERIRAFMAERGSFEKDLRELDRRPPNGYSCSFALDVLWGQDHPDECD